MKNNFTLVLGMLFVAVVSWPLQASSQEAEVKNAVYSDVSIPLRDMDPLKKHFWKKWEKEIEKEVPNQIVRYPDADPNWIDGVLQTDYSTNSQKAILTNPIININGLNNGNNTGRVTPPDPAGDIGPNHYVQVVNSMLEIYNKTGSTVFGPVATATIWSGFNGPWTGHNDGDGIVLYDENADRWLISQFAIDCGTSGSYTEYELVAISTSPDPTGSYYRYAFQFDYMPDYPKLGVWQDGYYMAINRFNTNNINKPFIGAGACVMERNKMLTGDPAARMIYFKTETLGGTGAGTGSNCYSMLPSDCDGTMPSAGTPNYFAYIRPAVSTTQMRIWALQTDWVNTANSTFTFQTALTVSSFAPLGSVPQQGTSLVLDALSDRLMFRNQYRNFGTYESFITCHSVSTGGIGGIRWYEYRRTGGTLSLYQQGTYAPADGKYRWMGSIAMNAVGDIGMVYTTSSSSSYASIYFTGRKAGDALGTMTQPESTIQIGTLPMTDATRWGDYSAINVDPSDNQTFWATHEYIGTYGGWSPWSTKIASFKFTNTPLATTLPATAVAGTSATLNGTVNPYGFTTNYHFEWGTTTSYGNSTTPVSAGAGTNEVTVSGPINNLVAGTTYHFRLVATNADGTCNGSDMTFTAGAAVVTTSAVTAITATSATCGGNVVSDGGTTVTVHGVCWGTSNNPTISNTHTSDGPGTGSFASSITGLSPATTYYVRAFATNSSGTSYGENKQFTTFCPDAYSVPFSQDFTGLSDIPNCWLRQNTANPALFNWAVGTTSNGLTGTTTPYAFATYTGATASTASLLSPIFDFTGYTSITIAFTHCFYLRNSGTGTATFSYSLDGGNTWIQILQWTASTTNPATFSQAIPALGGQSNVRFRWSIAILSGTRAKTWSFDDLNITGTATNLFANFNANTTEGLINEPITFTNASGSGANSWSWNFGGGAIPATASTQGPHTVTYNTTGFKTVNLTVNGSITKTKTNYISVTESPYMPPRQLTGTVATMSDVYLNWLSPRLNDGFEQYTDFNLTFGNYIQRDIDGSPTYGIANYSFPNMAYTGSFIIFNPVKVSPPLTTGWEPYTGRKYAACFAATLPPNNDWLITSKIKVSAGESFSFYAKSYMATYGLERFKVGISTTGTATGDFTTISPSPYVEPPTTWTKYTYALSAYTGQDIYLAINCVSNDAFALFLDDLKIEGGPTKNTEPEIVTSLPRETGIIKLQKIKGENGPLINALPENSRSASSFASYNIYRNNVMISNAESFNFLDEQLPPGTYDYSVKAQYTDPAYESPASNVAQVIVGAKTWRGASSADWQTNTNWLGNSKPVSADQVRVPYKNAVNFPVVSGVEAQSTDLLIETGASVTIAPDGKLTSTGILTNNNGVSGLVIKSNVSGTGSLKHNTSGVEATAERYVTAANWNNNGDGWHLLSSPIAMPYQGINGSWTPTDPGNDYDFYALDETKVYEYWLNQKISANNITQFIPGTGYLVAYQQADTKSFHGPVTTNNVTLTGLSHTATSAYPGYHLVGNPFACAIDWNAGTWTKTNIDANAYVWSNGAYLSTVVPGFNYIPSMNGFMIRVNTNPGTLTLPADSRLHNATNWYKAGDNEMILLRANDIDLGISQTSIVRFNPLATSEFDTEYDSYFVSGFAPLFYSVTAGNSLLLNTLSDMAEGLVIPFLFVKNVSTNFNIELIERISGTILYLEDKKTNTIQNLSEKPVYSFTSAEGDDANRFLLHFSGVGIDAPEIQETFTVFQSNGNFNVITRENVNAEIMISNILGQLIFRGQTNGKTFTTINASSFQNGVYLVSLKEENKIVSKKIVYNK